MDYSVFAEDIKNIISKLHDEIDSIDNINFDTVWSGNAHDTQITDLKNSLSTLTTQNNKILEFTNNLELLQKYKNNCSKISSLRTKLSNSLNDIERNSINDEISGLLNNNSEYKSNILSFISSISDNGTTVTLVNHEVSDNYMEYIVDLGELLNKVQSGDLSKISDNKSLYDYYNREELLANLDSIKSQYSGRDAVVNCALGVISMAASVNKSIDYELIKGTNRLQTTDAMVSGTDCCTFASWALSQGSDKITKTYSTKEFFDLGTPIEFSDAQVGDIFTMTRSSGGGHVMVVVDNAPQEGLALVAESKSDGVVLTRISYDTLKEYNYEARDLSSIY